MLSENLKTFFCCLLIAVAGQIYASEKPGGQGLWKSDVVVDGIPEEWDGDKFQFDAETNMWYCWANDGVFLYLCAKKSIFPNKIYNSEGGLRLYISKDQKKGRFSGDDLPMLTYPAPEGRGNPERFDYIEVANIAGIDSLRIPRYNPYGIQAACTFVADETDLGFVNGFFQLGTCYYELAIPLSLIGTEPGQALSLYVLLRGNHAARPVPREGIGMSGNIHMMSPTGESQTLTGRAKEVFTAQMADGARWGELWSTYILAEGEESSNLNESR